MTSTSDRDLARPIPVLVSRGLTLTVVILSAIGLLSIPIGVYDDSLLLLGARLVRAGKVPYLDFYTHYGPFGYTIIEFLNRLVASPAVSLRVAQITLLAGLGLLGHVVSRGRSSEGGEGSEGAIPLVVLALSAGAIFPSFLGYAFAVAALLLFIAARNSHPVGRGYIFALLGGAAFGVAILTRPAFAIYSGAGLFLIATNLLGYATEGKTRSGAITGLFMISAVATGVLLWVVLFRRIPIQIAFDATLVFPARLISTGERSLEPAFLRDHPLAAIAAGSVVGGSSLLWAFAVPPGWPKALAAMLALASGILPVVVRVLSPGHLSRLGLMLFPLPLLLILSQRRFLREHPDVGSAAAAGVAAAAFAHYFWSRADAPHLAPSLGLAACGVALIWRRLHFLHRALIVVLFALAFQIAARDWRDSIFPILRLSAETHRPDSPIPPNTRWGCEAVPAEIARAVSLADRNARPGSRFVAVGSSHASTQGAPALAFLISARLPYTKWFQYDPGLQSSPSVQKEMEMELIASGSASAVVWPAGRFLFDRRPLPAPETPFDAFFDRLFPRTIGRFGDYEVRAREPSVESEIQQGARNER